MGPPEEPTRRTVALDQQIRGHLARLAGSLGQAAKFGQVAASIKELAPDTKWPEGPAFFTFRGTKTLEALDLFRDQSFSEVRGNFSRFATQYCLVYMVAALEECVGNLLLIARVAQDQHGGQQRGYRYLEILARTRRDVRASSAIGLLHMLYDVLEGTAQKGERPLEKPHFRRLGEVVRLRNCIAHRRGQVVAGFDVDGSEALKVTFLHPTLLYEGKEITGLTHLCAGTQVTYELRESTKEWRPDEEIQLGAGDLQIIATSIFLDSSAVGEDTLAYLLRRLPTPGPGTEKPSPAEP